jgi:hypothetical protein
VCHAIENNKNFTASAPFRIASGGAEASPANLDSSEHFSPPRNQFLGVAKPHSEVLIEFI